MRASHSCLVDAYSNLFGGCTRISSDQDSKDRLTWDLSVCPPFPRCDAEFPTRNCLKHLDDDAHKVFLQYFLQIDSICQQLQYICLLILDNVMLEEKGKILLEKSKHIHGALSSIDEQTQQVAETSRNLEENVRIVKIYSEEVYELEVEGQDMVRERLNEGMEIVQDSYSNLGAEILSLRDETAEIEREREIEQVGEAMFSRMDTLQNKADDIQNLTVNSLDNQKKLLETQTAALEGLRLLTIFQSQPLQESRGTLQELSKFGKKQQEELLHRQEQLQRAHNQLAQNSKTILAAQDCALHSRLIFAFYLARLAISSSRHGS